MYGKIKLNRLWALFLVVVLLATAMMAGCQKSSENGTEKTTDGTAATTAAGDGTDTAGGAADTADGTQKDSQTMADEQGTDSSDNGQLKDSSSDDGQEAVPQISGLTYESKMALSYAEGFDVYYYEDDYALIDVHDDAAYLVVPEGKPVPEGLDADIRVLMQPMDTVYLAATSAMALFDALNSLDVIKMTGTAASGWYIDNAVKAMESGDMVFAGKYSEPDYEMLVDEDCDLAIESTMILHVPKVQEMIEMLGIPVFIDRSSYETHPLGRTEWIKAYSVLVDKEEEAAAFFEKQSAVINELKDFPNTEKTVAFFYVNTDGSVVVRKSDDYIPVMIEIAGGRYAFSDLKDEESNRSSIPMTMEEFYATAVDADYLIYNATIDSPVGSVDELTAKSELFKDFKAVKEGNVWTTGKYLYQATDVVSNLITDVHLMLTGGDESQMTFLSKIE